MRVLKLVPALLLFLLLGGPVVLLPRPASAWCCGCGMCSMAGVWGCQCPGYNGCPWCAADDSATSESNASKDEVANQSSVVGSLQFTLAKSDINERVKELMRRGTPTLANFSLKPLENTEGRKFTCPNSDYDTSGNTLLQFVRAYIEPDRK